MAYSGRYLMAVALLVAIGAGLAGAAERAGAVALKFSVFAQTLPQEIKYRPEPDESPVELRFYSTARSRVYEYEGPSPLVFFREVEMPPDPQRPGVPRVQRVTVGYVEIPSGMREALILFSTDGTWSENTIPIYRVQAVDDSVAAFPPEHVMFLNATGQPLWGTVGDRQVDVSSGASPPVKIPPGETPVRLNAAINGNSVPVYQERLAVDPKQRLTVVLFPPYRADVVRVQRRLLYDPNRPPVIKRFSEAGE